jgi:transcriptional regulator with XRE-family HTH domain
MPVTVDIGSFGPTLRARREAQDVSLRQLARRASVSAPALSLIERGKTQPSWLNLWRICGALDVSLAELIDELESEEPI